MIKEIISGNTATKKRKVDPGKLKQIISKRSETYLFKTGEIVIAGS